MVESDEQRTRVRYVDIDEHSDGQRIDNFLLSQLKGVPKSWVYRVLRKGEVRVNKGRVKPTRRLQIGDQVRIPPVRTSTKTTMEPGKKIKNIIDNSIIYEDKLMLIINKPSGIAVHGGSGVSHGVIEILRSIRPDAPYLELAHRLDRDTSGCLMLAKKRSALKTLQELQLKGRVEKRYLALLAGRWRKGRVTVTVPLQKNTLRSGERIVRVDPEGKNAVTHFEVRERFQHATLVDVRLETGRTHQIRVHAQHQGSPIIGDEKYGDETANRHFRGRGIKRLFLHAERLKFPWPERRQGYEFQAPLPVNLEDCLEQLRENEKV